MASIKRNFLYNCTITAGTYIFPMLTYPYVSRVLGVTNIGICNYVDSIINYFILFSALGVTTLGIREIAKAKNDQKQLNTVFSSFVSFNVILTIISILSLSCLTAFVPFFEQYRPFIFIGIAKLLMSAFLIEWFYQGMSNFRYITIRFLIVRMLYVIGVFTFVHSKDDSAIYYLLSSGMVVINACINWTHSRRFVRLSFKDVNLRLYVLPIVSYGVYSILTSIYTSFNVVYLGSVTNNTEVGYFTTATKLYTILMGAFTAFTTVMVPKVSELLGSGDNDSLKRIAEKTFDTIFAFMIPVIIISCCYAPLIIHIIAGEGYDGAIIPFRIITVLFLVIALEQIIIQQYLMAITNSHCIVLLSSIGATVGTICNIFLVGKLASIGSAIAWSSSEIVILCSSLYFFKKHFNMQLPALKLLKYLIAYLPMLAIYIVWHDQSISIGTVAAITAMLLWFCIVNIKFMHNEVALSIINKVRFWKLK